MTIIETKADRLLALVDEKKSISAKEAAIELQVTEEYIKKLSIVLQKNKLLNLKAGTFTLTLTTNQT